LERRRSTKERWQPTFSSPEDWHVLVRQRSRSTRLDREEKRQNGGDEVRQDAYDEARRDRGDDRDDERHKEPADRVVNRGRAALADVGEQSHPERRHGDRQEETGATAFERELAEALLQQSVKVTVAVGLSSQGSQSTAPEQRDRDRRDQKRRVPRVEAGVTLAGAAVKLHEELAAECEDAAQRDEEPAEPGEPPARPKSHTSIVGLLGTVSLQVRSRQSCLPMYERLNN